MKKSKKMITFAVALMLSVSMIAGCGKKDNSTETTKTETTTEQGKVATPTNSNNNEVVLTVGESKLTKAYANIYLYSTKLNIERMGMGETIWVNEVQPGKTFEAVQLEQLKDTLRYVTVINEEAKKRNITLNEEETKKYVSDVDQIWENLPQEIKDYYGFTKEDFVNFFTAQGLVVKVFEEEMKDFKADEEAVKAMLEADQNYQKIKEIGVDHYFDKVRARHILISTLDGERKPLPEDKKAEAKKKAEEILAKAKAGEDFAALAKEHSEDPGSKDNGGEYTFGRGQMVPEFEKTAFELEVGGISGLVETTFGYHIIKLEEKIASTDEEKANAKQLIDKMAEDYKEKLKTDEFEKRFEEIAKNYKIEFNDKVFETMSLSYSVPMKAPETSAQPEEKKEETKEEKSEEKKEEK